MDLKRYGIEIATGGNILPAMASYKNFPGMEGATYYYFGIPKNPVNEAMVPVLLLRGAQSDLVLPETVAEMRTRGPGARGLLEVVEVPGCGHAPALNVPQHYALVDQFLARCS